MTPTSSVNTVPTGERSDSLHMKSKRVPINGDIMSSYLISGPSSTSARTSLVTTPLKLGRPSLFLAHSAMSTPSACIHISSTKTTFYFFYDCQVCIFRRSQSELCDSLVVGGLQNKSSTFHCRFFYHSRYSEMEQCTEPKLNND